MTIRSLSKARTEATYANQWKHPTASSKSVKHTQYAINRYHRAVRRSQRFFIEEGLADCHDERVNYPFPKGRTHHSEGNRWFADDVGLWDIERGEYIRFRDDDGLLCSNLLF